MTDTILRPVHIDIMVMHCIINIIFWRLLFSLRVNLCYGTMVSYLCRYLWVLYSYSYLYMELQYSKHPWVIDWMSDWWCECWWLTWWPQRSSISVMCMTWRVWPTWTVSELQQRWQSAIGVCCIINANRRIESRHIASTMQYNTTFVYWGLTERKLYNNY